MRAKSLSLAPNRRQILTGISASIGGLAAFPWAAAAEPPPEISRVRLIKYPGVSDCFTPLYAAEELLRAEGFTEVEYVPPGGEPAWPDFELAFAPECVRLIARDIQIKVLAGMHSGCMELIASKSIGSVKDLKGRRVGIDEPTSAAHVLLMIMMANIGLDPSKDFEWVPGQDLLEMFARGEIDAFLGIPPQPQMARARGLGHVILNTNLERPWSQYFCCMLMADQEYVEKYPVATKRVMRALLKAADLCVSDPQAAARRAADRGMASSYDYALQTLQDARYNVWRSVDAADTMRFYSLRLLEAGLITASPQDIISKGTDWRFLEELKQELKT